MLNSLGDALRLIALEMHSNKTKINSMMVYLRGKRIHLGWVAFEILLYIVESSIPQCLKTKRPMT